MTLLPYAHLCHNLLIHSCHNKGYPREFIRITICLSKARIIRVVDLETAGPNTTDCIVGVIRVYICLGKAQPSFHVESFHLVPPTPGVLLLFPFARTKKWFILPGHSWNSLRLLILLTTANLSSLLLILVGSGIHFLVLFQCKYLHGFLTVPVSSWIPDMS